MLGPLLQQFDGGVHEPRLGRLPSGGGTRSFRRDRSRGELTAWHGIQRLVHEQCQQFCGHALHRAVIAYASDFTLLGTCVLPHGLSWMRNELVGASLDHAIWFHRPARADEWLLYATDSPWSGGSRGFNRGRVFNREGQLVASVAQEGMVRRRTD